MKQTNKELNPQPQMIFNARAWEPHSLQAMAQTSSKFVKLRRRTEIFRTEIFAQTFSGRRDSEKKSAGGIREKISAGRRHSVNNFQAKFSN